jgi:hypothetical protein
MAKATAKSDGDQSPAANLLKFRDTVFTSRTLCIPGTERTLPVVKATVEVEADDAQALAFLQGNTEFVALE